jgi:hypothetical protein
MISRKRPVRYHSLILQNSLPDEARGHTIHAFEINVIDGKEQLGECLAVTPSADHAISIAGQTRHEPAAAAH